MNDVLTDEQKGMIRKHKKVARLMKKLDMTALQFIFGEIAADLRDVEMASDFEPITVNADDFVQYTADLKDALMDHDSPHLNSFGVYL